jgi:hypothetical protein
MASSKLACIEFGHLLEPFNRCSDQVAIKVVDRSPAIAATASAGDEAGGPKGNVPLLEAAKEEDDPALQADRVAILKVLTEDLWSTDKKELPRALAKLSTYCVDSEPRNQSNKKFILENDGVGLVTQVMKMNHTDVEILAWGAAALANLIDGYSVACNKVHRLGGAQTILAAMKEHPDNGLIQSTGCCFIGNFIWNDRERIKLAVDLGGIDSILRAMARCPEDKHLHKCACWVLFSLCQHKEYVAVIAKSGGLGLIARTLELHRDDDDIKSQAKFIITALQDYLLKN